MYSILKRAEHGIAIHLYLLRVISIMENSEYAVDRFQGYKIHQADWRNRLLGGHPISNMATLTIPTLHQAEPKLWVSLFPTTTAFLFHKYVTGTNDIDQI